MAYSVWVLFDGRACGGVGTDSAAVLVSCDSDNEARSYAGDYGTMACYRYRVEGSGPASEQWAWDWSPDEGYTYSLVSL